MNTVLRYLRKMIAVEDSRALQDGDLLRRFVERRDEAAFAALVERHGPLVLAACRRVLHNQQDAEDVLQATYLVLARRANRIRRQDSVGSWLYGVAYRMALKLRGRQARQLECERRTAAEHRSRAEDMTWADLQPVLDEELYRLPDKYRAPILLCCLQGKSRDEAARELGWAEGAVKIRLERGRELLRGRLARRGLVFSAALWAVLLTKDAATAALPVRLAATLAETGVCHAAGQNLAGRVPASVLALSEGCLRSMALARLQTWAAGLLTAAGLGAAVYATVPGRSAVTSSSEDVAVSVSAPKLETTERQLPSQQPEIVAPAEVEQFRVTGTLRLTQVADTRRVTLQLNLPAQAVKPGREPRPLTEEKTYRLRNDAPIFINGAEAGFADLLPGMAIALELSADQKSVVCLRATSIP